MTVKQNQIDQNLGTAKTAIVILNWNGWQDTIECLQSLCHLASDDFTVIVVDNASKRDSRQNLLAWGRCNVGLTFAGIVEQTEIESANVSLAHKEWVYVQSMENGGFAKGNNLGIKLALNLGCEYVWLLNNDTVVDVNALNALESRIKSSINVGMCGSILRYFDDRDIVQAVGGVNFNFLTAHGEQLGQGLRCSDHLILKLVDQSPSYIAGASLFLSSDFLRDVGLMEESYFLYFEEIDWATRAKPRWLTATALESIVYHKEGASIGTASRTKRSRVSQYYLHRNLIRFYALRMPWLLPIAFFSVFKELIKLFIKQDWPLAAITLKALVDGVLMQSGPKTI